MFVKWMPGCTGSRFLVFLLKIFVEGKPERISARLSERYA